jgi:hypothetical protein
MVLAELHSTAPAATNRVTATLQSSVFMGSFVRHLMTFPDGQSVIVQTSADAQFLSLTPGVELSVQWPEAAGVLLCE